MAVFPGWFDCFRGGEVVKTLPGKVNSPNFNFFRSLEPHVTIAGDVTLLRPISDISSGNWTSAYLYDKIDEVLPNESDVITSETYPLNDACEVAVGFSGTPFDNTRHYLRYRIKNNSDGTKQMNFQAGLYQGTRLIGSGVHFNVPVNKFITTGFSLTTGEAATITDYSNLRLRFIATTGAI